MRVRPNYGLANGALMRRLGRGASAVSRAKGRGRGRFASDFAVDNRIWLKEKRLWVGWGTFVLGFSTGILDTCKRARKALSPSQINGISRRPFPLPNFGRGSHEEFVEIGLIAEAF